MWSTKHNGARRGTYQYAFPRIKFATGFKVDPTLRRVAVLSPLPPNPPNIEAIAERVRAVIARHPRGLNDIADEIGVPADSFRRLIDVRERSIHTPFLLDVVAGLVQEMGLDPKWLLSGKCDGVLHRQALSLGEDRSHDGTRKMRNFVKEQFSRVG
jgi:hypothetical protein